MPTKIIFILVLLVAAATTVFAIPYKIGEYTVDVEVRNSAMNVILDAKVRCYFNGNNTITIKAKAAGYQTAKRTISLYPNQFFYKSDLELRDVETKISIIDLNEDVITSAYARKDQYGFESNQYGMTIFIPVVDWKNASEQNVDIIEPFFGLPVKKTCEIKEVDQFYQVRIAITRKALDWYGPDLLVVFNTKVPNRPEVVSKKIAKILDIPAVEGQKMAMGRLSEFLAKSYSPAELRDNSEVLPEALEPMVKQIEKFNQVHRENF